MDTEIKKRSIQWRQVVKTVDAYQWEAVPFRFAVGTILLPLDTGYDSTVEQSLSPRFVKVSINNRSPVARATTLMLVALTTRNASEVWL